MFTPTPREAQMIEAIAEAFAKVHEQTSGSKKSWSQLMVEHLRSLARGGGEETAHTFGYNKETEYVDQPVQFSPAQVEAIQIGTGLPDGDFSEAWYNGYMQALKNLQGYLDSHTSKE